MRKILSAMVLIAFLFTLSACVDKNAQNEEPANNEETNVVESNTSTEDSETEKPADADDSDENLSNSSEVVIDYGKSDVFSKEDMDEAINIINGKFAKWRDCDVHSIRFGGDDKNIEDNVEWANDCIQGQNFTEVMEFETDFHSPTEVSGEWGDSDTEYDDYQWWFARPEDGKWQLFYWSY
ncbi:MAG: hypothetical protein J5590_04790 [Clostridia bacterium]|nr:hypothetical protein [Clostridia bacterium]